VAARATLSGRFPIVTVVTDLVDTHSTWFSPGVDLCTVPSPEVRERALQCGLAPEKGKVIGLPVSLKFSSLKKDKGGIRRRLGLEQDHFTVLLVGGGEGMGKVYEMAQAVAKARLPLQLIAVAGRNERLQRRLEAASWKNSTPVYGFVPNMPELMATADVIVTKAGACTISEALVMGLPILISSFVPVQEAGNVRHVVEGGAGLLAYTPQKLVAALRDLLTPGNPVLARMAANAQRLARPDAALEIARLLLTIK
jgi:1,2-diacylglycerol 3-beta-galactosyltransferase